ncbi:MAG: PD40 domain-containing protein, partial [Verrucomicrobia bacterium]|nr:PD40 domain-containing protein [Verrucomicrobiota bacterium]
MFLKRKFLAVLFCTFLFGIEKISPIVVPLETVKTLPSLYFSESMTNGQIEPDYKDTLLEVLKQDILQSYHFDLVMGKLDVEPLVSGPLQKHTKELSAFKSDFVLLPKIEQKKFILKLYEPRFHTSTLIGEFAINGKLDQDRLEMHQLFDAMHQKIFQQNGIASSKILFCRKTADIDGEWISDIYEMHQDGSFLKKITSSQNYLITPIMIPKTRNGSDYEYLFVSYEKGQPKIFRGHSKQHQSSPLLPMRGNQLLPAFSPLGDKIAFICDASGKTDLFLQQFHPSKGVIGKPIQLFSKPNSTQASPSFSPCGSKIAFVSDKDGAPKIYILEIIDAIRLQKTPPVRL